MVEKEALKFRNVYQQGVCLRQKAQIQLYLGNLQKSSEYYFKALGMNQKLGNKHAEASVLGNIGNVYYSQSNYTTALEYDLKALKITGLSGSSFNLLTHSF